MNVTYVGQSNFHASRYILCDVWVGSHLEARGPNSVLNYSMTYYAATPATTGLEYAPVRIEVAGSMVDTSDPLNPVTTRSFAYMWDWVDFSFQRPPSSAFDLPSHGGAGCSLPILPADGSALADKVFGDGRPGAASFFPSDTLGVAPIPTSFPSLPANFQLVLEAKLAPYTTVSPSPDPNTYDPDVFTYQWSMNSALGAERLDFTVLTSDTNQGLEGNLVGTGQAARIDVRNSDAIGGDTVYQYKSDGATASCTTEALSLANPSPLNARRAGSLQNLFSGLNADKAFRDAVYVERTNLRGVEVDRWRLSLGKFNGDAYFAWDMDVYFYNALWRFPGRLNLLPGVGIPMRVVNSGKWINSSYTVSQAKRKHAQRIGLFWSGWQIPVVLTFISFCVAVFLCSVRAGRHELHRYLRFLFVA